MKKFALLMLLCAAVLTGEEFSPTLPELKEEECPLPLKDQSRFIYFAGGLNPLPTLSLGYRKLYGAFGSDFSISGTAVPIFTCHSGVVVVPGLLYKQLFFTGRGWQGLEPGSSAFYIGPQAGVHVWGGVTTTFGALIGWQFKRKHHSDFFELGTTPVIIDRGLVALPLFSINYAFMF